jgi:outer membrane protein assembly factor BamB
MKPKQQKRGNVLAVALFFSCVHLPQGKAADLSWPQFRGPNGSGVQPEANPPIKIGPDDGVRWKVDVPPSPSSPCVWGDRIYLTTFHEGQLQTRAYRREDGALVWTASLKPETLEVFHRTCGSPAASTVATDGRHVISYFGSIGLICYDTEGKELWRHPMPVAESAGKFGTGTSPIIVDQTVILSRDERVLSKLLALDVATGRVKWESPRTGLYGFGTPMVWRNEDTTELVLPGFLHLKGYDLQTGRERWSIQGLTKFSCTTAVVGEGRLYYGAWSPGGEDNPRPEWSKFSADNDPNGDGVIHLTELEENRRDFFRPFDLNEDGKITESDWDELQRTPPFTNQLIAVKAGGQGDITDTHVLWKYEKALPYVPSPLFYQGRIYMIKDGGILTSIDAETGQLYYQKRLPATGSYFASPVAANGRIYVVSVEGELSVIKAGGDKPEILHKVDFEDYIFATPALIGDELYLRSATKLYAFGGS